jgi:hypothetical protein
MTVSLTTDNQSYTLASGQTVTSAGSFDVVKNAIRVDARNVSLNIAGTVDGGSEAGLLLDTGVRVRNPDPYAGASFIPYFYDNSSMAVNVAAGGRIAGYYGIYLRVHPLNLGEDQFGGLVGPGGTARATLDNSGTIAAQSGGWALYSQVYQNQPIPGAVFASVTNRAGGFIGAIEAKIETLTNAGMIDGGGRNAITSIGDIVIENSGRITTMATAIQSDATIRLTNAAAGIITGNGGTAIAANGWLVLANSGTINGNIDMTQGSGAALIDNSKGVINGNVFMGGGNDTFVGRMVNGVGFTGVAASLNGGGGTDTLALVVSGTVSAAMPALPTGFERLSFELNDAASLSITDGTASAIVLAGRGSFSTAATISGDTTALSFGPRLANAIETGPPIALRNSGVLSSSFGPGSEGNAVAAVFFKSSDLFEISPVLSRFENSGSITAVNARAVIVSIGGRPDAVFDNSGTITSTTARAVELTMVGTVSNQFSNSGTVNGATLIDFRPGAPGAISAGSNSGRMEAVGEVLRMTGGDFTNAGGQIVSTGNGNFAAISFGNASAGRFENSGSITSVGVGLEMSNGRLVNTGSITSSQQQAVKMSGGTALDNGVTGVLRGGNGIAVQRQDYDSGQTVFNVTNAGLIDGDLVLNSSNYSGSSVVTNSGTINGRVLFGVGNDRYYGAGGTQHEVRGGWGDEWLYGGSGNDLFYGEQGDDLLDGGAGNDVLIGGAGSDLYFVDSQADVVIELADPGFDAVFSTGSFYLYANIEQLTLEGSGDHFGVGNALANTMIGNDGSNLLLGGGGDDAINGGGGDDSIFGEAGNDGLLGDDGIDYLVGGAGNDELWGLNDADALYGEDGDDYLVGGDDFATDILVGGAGNDFLEGASGLGDYDLMDGGAGDDVYYVDTPDDLTFEAVGGGTDVVYAGIAGAGYYLYANVENLRLIGETPFGVGNELDNRLTGNAIGNYLLGGLGNDTLNGKAGNDVLFGEGGADIFVFERGTGGDVIGDFDAGADKISLVGLGFANYAALQPNIFEVGGNTGINLGFGDFIVLNGVANAQLSASDFLFG